MTGLSTLLVELDDPAGSGTWPYDITQYVDLREGWTLTRGRQDEFDEVDASTARLTLNNRDGRFTLGSVAYGIVVDQRLRISESFAGGPVSRRITGYVQDWPVTFADAGARNVPCAVTVTDALARFSRRKLTAALAQEQRADSPAYLYALSEAAGAQAAGDTSGNRGTSLSLFGTGSSPTFGADTGTDQTGVVFAGGKYLRRTSIQAASYLTYEFAVIVPVGSATPTQVFSMKGADLSDVRISIEADGTVSAQAFGLSPSGNSFTLSPTSIADGLPHLVTLRVVNNASTELFVDGVSAATGSLPGALSAFDELTVGLSATGGITVFGVAAYPTALSSGRIAAHYRQLAVTVSESSDTRLARLASYGNVPSGDLALEVGVETRLARQTLAGASLASAMQEVASTEGGTLFINGAGKVVAHNRQHRVLRASQAPAVALTSEDVMHDDFQVTADKQYLQNEVTGSRPDGGQQVARNTASIDKYEQYPADLPSLLVTTDAEVADRVNWVVGAYGEPLPRLNKVTIDLLTLASTAAGIAKVRALLALELGGRITIGGLPSQSPIATADLLVEGLEERQSADSWQMAFNTVSAELFRAWILGNTTYGVLGSTTRLHY